MTAPAPYGYAQPDALAFLDQPLADFDSVLQTQPLQALGDSAVDSYITLPYAQTPAWSQSPGFKVWMAAGNLLFCLLRDMHYPLLNRLCSAMLLEFVLRTGRGRVASVWHAQSAAAVRSANGSSGAGAAGNGVCAARGLASGRRQHAHQLPRHRAPLQLCCGGSRGLWRLAGGPQPPQWRANLQLRPGQPAGELDWKTPP